MFSLKIPSLLKFDQLVRLDENTVQVENLEPLIGVNRPPSDTRIRERLDDVDPRSLRPCFTITFSSLQRGKVLERWTVYKDYYLIAIDGAGCHFSHKIKCKNGCVKNHRNGSTEYYRRMLVATMTHLEHSAVLPLALNPSGKKTALTKTTANAMQQSDFWTILAGNIRT